jgi:hypothetical protein
MNKIVLSLTIVAMLFACNDASNHIGKSVETQSAISVKDALATYNKDGKETEQVVYGKVADVCQSEGCWFSYDLGDSTLTVDFNDEFTVPKNINHKDLYAVGHFYKDTAETSSESNDSTVGKKMVISTKFRAHGVKFK